MFHVRNDLRGYHESNSKYSEGSCLQLLKYGIVEKIYIEKAIDLVMTELAGFWKILILSRILVVAFVLPHAVYLQFALFHCPSTSANFPCRCNPNDGASPTTICMPSPARSTDVATAASRLALVNINVLEEHLLCPEYREIAHWSDPIGLFWLPSAISQHSAGIWHPGWILRSIDM